MSQSESTQIKSICWHVICYLLDYLKLYCTLSHLNHHSDIAKVLKFIIFIERPKQIPQKSICGLSGGKIIS